MALGNETPRRVVIVGRARSGTLLMSVSLIWVDECWAVTAGPASAAAARMNIDKTQNRARDYSGTAQFVARRAPCTLGVRISH